MAVKKKDRHQARNDCLAKCRKIVEQALLLTRPPVYNSKTGKRVRRAGKLGEGQPFQVFGLDIMRCSKNAHGACYDASNVHLKDEDTLNRRTEYHEKAIEQLRCILRLLDLCIFEYGTSKEKRKSFYFMAKIVNEGIDSIKDRINRDNIIYRTKYKR